VTSCFLAAVNEGTADASSHKRKGRKKSRTKQEEFIHFHKRAARCVVNALHTTLTPPPFLFFCHLSFPVLCLFFPFYTHISYRWDGGLRGRCEEAIYVMSAATRESLHRRRVVLFLGAYFLRLFASLPLPLSPPNFHALRATFPSCSLLDDDDGRLVR
jgi:hypothetical protein